MNCDKCGTAFPEANWREGTILECHHDGSFSTQAKASPEEYNAGLRAGVAAANADMKRHFARRLVETAASFDHDVIERSYRRAHPSPYETFATELVELATEFQADIVERAYEAMHPPISDTLPNDADDVAEAAQAANGAIA